MEESRPHGSEVYRAVVDACPSAVLMTDLAGRIVLLNATAATMFGHAPEDLVGANLDDTLLPERLRERRRVWRQRYYDLPEQRPMLLDGVETVGLRSDGHEFPAEMHVTKVQVGDEPMVLAYIEDVTARRQLELEASAVSDDLVASVSHELRTPLTSIIGYTELLADEVVARVTDVDLREELMRMLQVVERNAGRERSLVEDLLTLAFVEDDGSRTPFEPVDVNAVVRRVVEDHRPASQAAGIALSVAEDASVGRVAGDRFRLHAVVDNLVSNAVKFTDPGGRVHVSVHDGGRLASIEVSDTGSGIAAGEVPRLFDRLYRSPSAVAAQKPGAGLGLPIVKQIVDAHDGHIAVQSLLGQGTRVQVDLPYADRSGSDA
ncbi:MAG: divL 2 [Marmoricola sp.]|nr:divL 2 [Marmoricola sp.]